MLTFSSAVDAVRNVALSGPCAVMHECSDAPPATNPTFASYLPYTMPMNSDIVLRW